MELIAAVQGVARGEAICPPKLCKSLFEYVSSKSLVHSGRVEQRGRPADDLTCRQRQLMTLVAKGMTNKEIAASLRLSEFTVRNHIHRIMGHLQADSRHAAVDAIRTAGLFLSAEGHHARNRVQTRAERQRKFTALPNGSRLIRAVS
jgi:DNA-binding NarL/FixJ family response regulator